MAILDPEKGLQHIAPDVPGLDSTLIHADPPVWEERKNSSILLNFSQQLARPVPAAGVDLRPLVEGGCLRGKHDQVFLIEAQPAHTRGGVVAAGP